MRRTLCIAFGLLWAAPGAASAQAPPAPAAVLAIEQTLIDAIARAERSVVAIARVYRAAPGEDPVASGEDFRRLVEPDSPDYVPNDFATGVVVGPGRVLTNLHALGNTAQSEYYVTTADRLVYRAKIVGADERVDLAVLTVDATDLPPIAWGNAAALRKGQIVVTLGNPYAIARDGQVSASWGIVSNLGRKAPGPANPGRLPAASAEKPTLHHYGTLIQTDARLNFGTSGGALIDLEGRLVGLTTSIAALAGHETAAGYAIPVEDFFRRAVEKLGNGEEVEYGFLGVAPRALSRTARLGGVQGVEVDRTIPGTPAAGRFEPTDVITHVEGRPVYDADGLVLEVARHPAGAETRLTVLRRGRGPGEEVPLRLAKARVSGDRIITAPRPAWRGLLVDFATAVLPAGELPAEPAVVVAAVEPDSAAAQAGLEVGQAIRRVNGQPVGTPAEFRQAVENATGVVTLERVAVGPAEIAGQ
jgi:serine protease Do